MSAHYLFQVKDKKCATCNFFQGTRRFELRANKPFYIRAEAERTACIATKRLITPGDRCLSWQKWVSIPEE